MAQNVQLDDRVVYINRVSKAVSGGSTFGFSTMVAVGNEDGSVGIGIGRDEEVPGSIEKGRTEAEKSLIDVPRAGSTIPHQIETEHDSARVLLKPASPGTGVIAGGAVRAVIELAGIRDILTKSLGSDNPLNIARATLKGLKNLKDPHRVAQMRDMSVEEILSDHPYAGPDDFDIEDDSDDEPETESAEESAESDGESEDETDELEEVEQEMVAKVEGSDDTDESSSSTAEEEQVD